ncbi:MAG: hypothetical protein HGA23_00325 [Bacteroidales bacterium]|nr:hypothetical protein [Bacteroidales bacterium]
MHFSSFNAKIGMIDGTRDSLTDQFIDYQGNIISEERAMSRSINVPFQIVSHNKISSVTNLLLKDNQIRFSGGYQGNKGKNSGKRRMLPACFFTWIHGHMICGIQDLWANPWNLQEEFRA